MIYGPQSHYPIHRIRPIDGDRQEDQREKKRRVLYQGRAWAEAEEDQDLGFQQTMQQAPAVGKLNRESGAGIMCSDRLILAKAEGLFKNLLTLEEKLGQLCFLSTESFYDVDVQHGIEKLIQTWHIGGLVFRRGDFRRQSYLIDRYQAVSKSPLLIANGFMHGLSFYLDGHQFPSGPLSEHYFSDMGKAVMSQNRRLGVHIQFDCEKSENSSFALDEAQAKAFRKGVREAHGVVGKDRLGKYPNHLQKNGVASFLSSTDGFLNPIVAAEGQVQELINFKTLTFLDLSLLDPVSLEKALLEGFSHYDLLLLSQNVPQAIHILAEWVRKGKIAESVLNRHVLKALAIKVQFFK